MVVAGCSSCRTLTFYRQTLTDSSGSMAFVKVGGAASPLTGVAVDFDGTRPIFVPEEWRGSSSDSTPELLLVASSPQGTAAEVSVYMSNLCVPATASPVSTPCRHACVLALAVSERYARAARASPGVLVCIRCLQSCSDAGVCRFISYDECTDESSTGCGYHCQCLRGA